MCGDGRRCYPCEDYVNDVPWWLAPLIILIVLGGSACVILGV